MQGKIKCEFKARIWQYMGQASWHFVSLPRQMGKEIRENLRSEEEGWGRMKTTAQIGSIRWETAIWFDTKHQTYLLPLKASIRKKEKLEAGKEINAIIWV